MSEKQTDQPAQTDHLSILQKKLDDLSVMFYSYIGILQRDAPPHERPPEQKDDIANDATARKQLMDNIPKYASDIVGCTKEINTIINQIDTKMRDQAGRERTLLDTANFESRQAGEEMSEAVDDAHKLLTSVRDLISAREKEPFATNMVT